MRAKGRTSAPAMNASSSRVPFVGTPPSDGYTNSVRYVMVWRYPGPVKPQCGNGCKYTFRGDAVTIQRYLLIVGLLLAFVVIGAGAVVAAGSLVTSRKRSEG